MSTENTAPDQAATIAPASVAETIAADSPQPAPEPVATPQLIASAETDAAGVPFDPKRHLPKKHPRTNRWMPRKPPKNATGAVATPQPAPEPSPWSETERADAAKAEIDATPESAPAANAEPQNVPEAITPAATRRAAARAGMRLIYTGTGIATGHPDEAVPPPREDKDLQDTASYILDASGWNPGPFIGFLVLLATYLIFVGSRPKTRQMLSDLVRGLWKKDVTPPPAQAPQKPTPAVPISVF